jgi:putative phosphoesterase
MKIAVISDVHGNAEALQTVLGKIKRRRVSRIYCLGDSIGYLPQADKVLEIIRKRKIKTLKGNFEKALVSRKHLKSRIADKSLSWSKEQLSAENRELIKTFPEEFKFGFNNLKFLMVHGSPWDKTEGRVYPDSDLKRFMRLSYDVFLMGNTHIPFQSEVRGKHIVNVGSAGFSRDGDPRLTVAFIEISKEAKVSIELNRFVYNPDITAELVEEFKFPRKVLNYLYFGSNSRKVADWRKEGIDFEVIYRLLPKKIFRVKKTKYGLIVENNKDKDFCAVIHASKGKVEVQASEKTDKKLLTALKSLIDEKTEGVEKRVPNFEVKHQLQYTLKHPLRLFKAYEYLSVYREQIKRLFEISAFDFVKTLSGIGRNHYQIFLDDLTTDNEFFFELKLLAEKHDPGAFSYSDYQYWNNLYYVMLRALEPEIVVETGVERGVSSAFALKALRDNRKGRLHSIDLPPYDNRTARESRVTKLPKGQDSGWIIPLSLRNRWELYKGKSEDLLPGLLQQLGKIDVFLHDSLHTYEHMLWEYKTAWKNIKKGGLLLSDNVDWDTAGSVFTDFAAEVNKKYVYKYGFGGIRK